MLRKLKLNDFRFTLSNKPVKPEILQTVVNKIKLLQLIVRHVLGTD